MGPDPLVEVADAAAGQSGRAAHRAVLSVIVSNRLMEWLLGRFSVSPAKVSATTEIALCNHPMALADTKL